MSIMAKERASRLTKKKDIHEMAEEKADCCPCHARHHITAIKHSRNFFSLHLVLRGAVLKIYTNKFGAAFTCADGLTSFDSIFFLITKIQSTL